MAWAYNIDYAQVVLGIVMAKTEMAMQCGMLFSFIDAYCQTLFLSVSVSTYFIWHVG